MKVDFCPIISKAALPVIDFILRKQLAPGCLCILGNYARVWYLVSRILPASSEVVSARQKTKQLMYTVALARKVKSHRLMQKVRSQLSKDPVYFALESFESYRLVVHVQRVLHHKVCVHFVSSPQ